MNFIIEGYIRNLSKDDVSNFANNNNIKFTKEELDFTYDFIKQNYQKILKNPDSFNFNDYKDRFSYDTFEKVDSLIKKYSGYL